MSKPPTEEEYVGDGVYVSCLDIYTIKLRAPRPHGDHEIYLDLDMMNTICDYLRRKMNFDVRQQ